MKKISQLPHYRKCETQILLSLRERLKAKKYLRDCGIGYPWGASYTFTSFLIRQKYVITLQGHFKLDKNEGVEVITTFRNATEEDYQICVFFNARDYFFTILSNWRGYQKIYSERFFTDDSSVKS